MMTAIGSLGGRGWRSAGLGGLARVDVGERAAFAIAQPRSAALHNIASEQDYEAVVKEGKSVAYFTAAWCGPCQAIKPVFNELAESTPGVEFAVIDIDHNQQLAGKSGIRGVPTFKFFKDGKMQGEIVGADVAGLQRELSALASAE